MGAAATILALLQQKDTILPQAAQIPFAANILATSGTGGPLLLWLLAGLLLLWLLPPFLPAPLWLILQCFLIITAVHFLRINLGDVIRVRLMRLISHATW